MKICVCGSGKVYLDCCGAFITHKKIPSTPEELMRSRYTAYCHADIDYIMQTMRSPASDDFDAESARQWAKNVNWAGLEVIKTSHGAVHGIVEFIAYYYVQDKKQTLHEISEFHFENGQWYYVDGSKPEPKKIGRNDSCPCGSQIKYKKCCGNG